MNKIISYRLMEQVARRSRESKSLAPHKLLKSIIRDSSETLDALDELKRFELYRSLYPEDFEKNPNALPLVNEPIYADIDEVNARLAAKNLPHARCIIALKDPEILYISGFLNPQFLSNLEPHVDEFMKAMGSTSELSDDGDIDLSSRHSRSAWASTKADDDLGAMLRFVETLLPNIVFRNRRYNGVNEDFQIVDYEEGGKYDPHCDEDNFPAGDTHRVSTALFYLKTPEKGGSTSFPRLGLTFTPKAGDLLLFGYGTENDMCNPYSLHTGTPVIKGQKRIMTLWTSKKTTI